VSLYLVPATRENLACSIETEVPSSKLVPFVARETIAEIQARAGVEGIRCWAMTPVPTQKAFFAKMKPGDIVLLTESDTGYFTHYAEVTFTLENKALGDTLWPFQTENSWELIYFLRNIQHIQIPKPEFVTKLGYKSNYAVPGTVRVSDQGLERFESEYGSLEKWFGIPYAHEEFAGLLGELHDGTAHDYSSSNVMGFAKRRVKHEKFAAQVKANYQEACAMCGIKDQGFLVASHIVPWSADEKNRINPANGLYLCVLHDRAFERGYLVLDDELFIRMNPRIHPTSPLGMLLALVNGLRLRQPLAAPPDPELLRNHRNRFPFSAPG
jgi:hypothetical protein